MRCIDGRKRCNIRCHAEHGDAVSAVQTALAVSDDVDLLGTCLFQTLNDGFLDLQSACVDVTCGFLAAVVDRRAVLYELGGNAAPVIQVLRVTEEYAVDHKYRVFCLADLQGLTLFVAPVSLALFADFASCDLNYYREHEKISNGDHAAEDAKKPHSDAYLL